MKSSRVFIVSLVIVNLTLLGLQLVEGQHNQPENIPSVVRAHAFEIVDGQGRVRAEIKILPAQPDLKMPDGSVGYPETVQLRLINSQGGPNVKLGTMEDGAGLVLGGSSGAGYLQFLSRGTNAPFIKLVGKDGHEQTIKPL
jgi:hypothetical protein